MVIQLCKTKGAWVATTCSPRTWSFVKSFNPDVIVDYTIENWDMRADIKVLAVRQHHTSFFVLLLCPTQ
jgi:NADPH:quinone reductase-like Zn-dependent oxidoreductase